jgi:hypothetical protein
MLAIEIRLIVGSAVLPGLLTLSGLCHAFLSAFVLSSATAFTFRPVVSLEKSKAAPQHELSLFSHDHRSLHTCNHLHSTLTQSHYYTHIDFSSSCHKIASSSLSTILPMEDTTNTANTADSLATCSVCLDEMPQNFTTVVFGDTACHGCLRHMFHQALKFEVSCPAK